MLDQAVNVWMDGYRKLAAFSDEMQLIELDLSSELTNRFQRRKKFKITRSMRRRFDALGAAMRGVDRALLEQREARAMCDMDASEMLSEAAERIGVSYDTMMVPYRIVRPYIGASTVNEVAERFLEKEASRFGLF